MRRQAMVDAQRPLVGGEAGAGRGAQRDMPMPRARGLAIAWRAPLAEHHEVFEGELGAPGLNVRCVGGPLEGIAHRSSDVLVRPRRRARVPAIGAISNNSGQGWEGYQIDPLRPRNIFAMKVFLPKPALGRV